MQHVVDSAVGVAKEAVKTVTREAFNSVINTVNGASALALSLLPGGSHVVQSLRGWELRPTFKAPHLPRWMEDGVSTLNFIYDDSDSDMDSFAGYESGREDLSMPPSPSSTLSYHSNATPLSPSFFRSQNFGQPRESLWFQIFRQIFWIFFWPLAFLFPRKPQSRRRSSGMYSPSDSVDLSQDFYPASSVLSRSSSSNTSLSRHFSIASHEFSKKFSDVLEYVAHLNDNRRRGIIEDLQLVLELTIDGVFEVLRGMLKSPWSTWCALTGCLTGRTLGAVQPPACVQTTTLGDAGATPNHKKLGLSEALNTDARTCEDVVREAGYPFEAIKVTTQDGYVLTLERIPRRDSRKVVLLQHGILDTSLGWVSNGVVGSQAFAAYDQEFDVWLGNMRGYASREHVDKHISAQEYWRYSVNEHGMFDIGAMVHCIHDTKLRELGEEEREVEGTTESQRQSTSDAEQPYLLSVVAHSLGGASVMLYLVTQCMKQEPHRFSRVILLSPAGFHEKTPLFFSCLKAAVPVMDPVMERFIPGFFIPTRGLRLLFNKLTQDFQNLPALKALVQVLMSSFLLGGDSSDWVGAMRQPHYNMYDMPGLSFRVVKHMAQMKHSKKFAMYDYGSERANAAVYGQSCPVDIGAHYGLVDIPVDVVMGRRDNLIPACMVKRHYQILKASGRQCSLKEFEYAHLDFTFAQHQDLLAYVMARLNLCSPKADSVARPKGGCRTPTLTVKSCILPGGFVRRVASASPRVIVEDERDQENANERERGVSCEVSKEGSLYCKTTRKGSGKIHATSGGYMQGKKTRPTAAVAGNMNAAHSVSIAAQETGAGLHGSRGGPNLPSYPVENDVKNKTVGARIGLSLRNRDECDKVAESDDAFNFNLILKDCKKNSKDSTSANKKKRCPSRVTEIEEVDVEEDASINGTNDKSWKREARITSSNEGDGILVRVQGVEHEG